MPDIATWHPQVVHFVIALAFVGIGARVFALLPLGPRFKFVNGMATSLIVMAAIAGVFAVTSGADAHGPVERVPGARDAVTDHEHKGEAARTALIVLAVIEIGALVVASKPKIGMAARGLAAAAGIVVAFFVYEAGEHGGTLVYNYAGGIGLRSGDSADVRRLLVAGLYHRAMAQRTAGAKDEAARLIEELVRQMPGDTTVQFLGIESVIRDQAKPRVALDLLNTMPIAAENARLRARRDNLLAEAYVAAGVPDSARSVLEALKARTPAGPGQDRIQAAIDKLPR